MDMWAQPDLDQSAGEWQVGTGEPAYVVEGGEGDGSPHISLAALIFMLIALKMFTESNLITTDLAELKISFLNIVSVLAITIPGIVLFKVATAFMAKKGFALPGQVELAKAI